MEFVPLPDYVPLQLIYDDFSFLIKDKEKIRTWLLKNLPLSSVVSYSISLCHAVESMDIPVENIATPKVEKVTRAIPEWSDNGAPIEVQIDEFTETLTGPTGKFLRQSSKTNYRSNIKTVMRRLHHTNLDFLISDVPGILKFLDDVNSKEDPNMRVLVKEHYI